MVNVTGVLTDYGRLALNGAQPSLRFIGSGAGMVGSTFLATRPVEVVPDTAGRFTVDLQPTDEVRPERWYAVVAEWLDDAGTYQQMTVWDRLYVPATGGDISTFPNQPLRMDLVRVGLDPGADYRGYWLSADPVDNNVGTGILYRRVSA